MKTHVPLGAGARSLAGVRYRGRPFKKIGAGAPKRSGNWHNDDDALALAICLLAVGDAGNVNEAATGAIYLRSLGQNGTYADLAKAFDGSTERSAAAFAVLRKRIRRVRDKLYGYADLNAHTAWLNSYPDLQPSLRAYRDRARLFGKGRAALLP